MTQLVLGGVIGLLLGIALHLTGMDRADTVRETLALRRRAERKSLLWAAGCMAVLTSLLMWLAVIDVDELPVLPLTGRVLAGGMICGISAGLTGFTPETALAGVGGGRFTESVCALLGGVAAYHALPWLQQLAAPTDEWFAPVTATVFRVTLDKPHLLSGGFLAQGCVGLLLLAMAICVRRFRPITPEASALPQESPPPSVEPETVQEETIVVSLPGEEPVVVDSAPTPEDEKE